MAIESGELILATGGYDHTIKLWQAHTGNTIKTMQFDDSQVNALDRTPDKSMLAACGYQCIRLYDMASNSSCPVINFEGVSKNVTRLGFQEDGKWMFTAGEDCRVRIWDMSSSNPQCKRMFDCQTPINAACLHPNQVELAIGSQGGCVYLWDVKSDRHDQLIPEVDASIQDIAISPDGNYMAAVNNKGNCYVWSLSNSNDQHLSMLKPKLKISAHVRYVLRCKFSPDSSLLVTTSGDGSSKIWKTTDFQLWRELKVDNKRWAWDAAFSADSKYLFVATSDSVARLWKLESKEIEREYIVRATDESIENVDELAVCMFCNLIRNNSNFIEKATALIINKINQASFQSSFVPQALRSLELLSECMAKCGSNFLMEVSKYRFLNKLIELVSMKHSVQNTPIEIREKIMYSLLLWTTQYPEKDKIKSVYDMLANEVKQTSQTNISSNDSSSYTNMPSNSACTRPSFMDSENENKLKKLLQSKNPEDLKRANLLIQYNVNQETRKIERVIGQKAELKQALNTAKLFNEILDNFEEANRNEESCLLIKDLYESCIKYKSIISKMPDIMDDFEDDLIYETIDTNDIILDAIRKHDKIFTEKNAASENSPKENKSISFLSHGNFIKEESVKPTNSVNELNELFSSQSSINDNSISNTNSGILQPFKILQPILTKEPNTANKTQLTNKTPNNVIDEDELCIFDVISDNLFKEDLKSRGRTDFFREKPNNISLNDMAKERNKNIFEKVDSMPLIEDKFEPIVSSLPVESESYLSKPVCSNILNSTKINNNNQQNTTQPKNVEKPCLIYNRKIVHLSEIHIDINEINPSYEIPRIVMDENPGLKIILHFALNKPSENVSVIVISTINQTPLPIEHFKFDASISKPCKIRLLEPTGYQLPGVKPTKTSIKDLKQILLILNPAKQPVDVTFLISYRLGEDPDPIKETFIVNSIPWFD